MDFLTGLNECLKTYEYPLHGAEDIFAKLNGGRVFSKLELSDAYQQVMFNEETSKLLTINTLKGLYSFNHLPFGCQIFQKIMDNISAEVGFALAYLDDILIKMETFEQHRLLRRYIY